MKYFRDFKKLCTPASVYLFINVIIFVSIAIQNFGNTTQYCVGQYRCNVPNTFSMFLFKAVYILFWTFILNAICKAGYKEVSWFMVLLPIILLFIILGIVILNSGSARLFEGFKEGKDGLKEGEKGMFNSGVTVGAVEAGLNGLNGSDDFVIGGDTTFDGQTAKGGGGMGDLTGIMVKSGALPTAARARMATESPAAGGVFFGEGNETVMDQQDAVPASEDVEGEIARQMMTVGYGMVGNTKTGRDNQETGYRGAQSISEKNINTNFSPGVSS